MQTRMEKAMLSHGFIDKPTKENLITSFLNLVDQGKFEDFDSVETALNAVLDGDITTDDIMEMLEHA